jgi:dehydrogenase/reductase SDR family protein 7B
LTDKNVFVAAFDLGEPEQRVKGYEAIQSHFGRVDVLVNNGGILRFGLSVELDYADVEQVTRVNYLANVHLAQLVTADWVRNGIQGRILVNSSIIAYISYPLLAAYGASKAAINVSPMLVQR